MSTQGLEGYLVRRIICRRCSNGASPITVDTSASLEGETVLDVKDLSVTRCLEKIGTERY